MFQVAVCTNNEGAPDHRSCESKSPRLIWKRLDVISVYRQENLLCKGFLANREKKFAFSTQESLLPSVLYPPIRNARVPKPAGRRRFHYPAPNETRHYMAESQLPFSAAQAAYLDSTNREFLSEDSCQFAFCSGRMRLDALQTRWRRIQGRGLAARRSLALCAPQQPKSGRQSLVLDAQGRSVDRRTQRYLAKCRTDIPWLHDWEVWFTPVDHDTCTKTPGLTFDNRDRRLSLLVERSPAYPSHRP